MFIPRFAGEFVGVNALVFTLEISNDGLKGKHDRIELSFVGQHVFLSFILVIQHAEYDVDRQYIALLPAKANFVIYSSI